MCCAHLGAISTDHTSWRSRNIHKQNCTILYTLLSYIIFIMCCALISISKHGSPIHVITQVSDQVWGLVMLCLVAKSSSYWSLCLPLAVSPSSLQVVTKYTHLFLSITCPRNPVVTMLKILIHCYIFLRNHISATMRWYSACHVSLLIHFMNPFNY